MERVDDGGPAFPGIAVYPRNRERFDGMSLWDYFVGQALCGLSRPCVAADQVMAERERRLAERERDSG